MLKFLSKPIRRLRLTAADKEFYQNLKKILGFAPDNLDVYKLALVHRSASLIISPGQKVDNERLEYLGDAILDAIVADYLFAEFPNSDEGFLTKMRAKIVSRNNMNQLAISIGLPEVVKVNNGALNHQKYIYGNALEAIVGAMFIDKGFKFTSDVVVNNFLRRHINLEELENIEHDYKSRILEIAQKLHIKVAFDTHDYGDNKQKPQFEAILLWNGKEIGRGLGQSKKEAEQQASMQGIDLAEGELQSEKQKEDSANEDPKNELI